MGINVYVNICKYGAFFSLLCLEKTSPKQTEKRKLLPRRSGIEWKVGCKLEAMDFLKKWCVCYAMALLDHQTCCSFSVFYHFHYYVVLYVWLCAIFCTLDYSLNKLNIINKIAWF